MKIEPHENGPLFVEMNFYIRAAKPQEVDDYRTRKGLTSLGMPVHKGSGSHIFKGDRYRFLVMDRLGKDLQKIFLSGKQTFPLQAAFNIAIKVLYSLEYIHSKGYVHNDIKAQNLLLGHGRTKENDLFQGPPRTPPSTPQDLNTALPSPSRAGRRNARSD
mgnify:CR=1 FL=1